MKDKVYPIVERAVKWLMIMLVTEFVLGTLLTTVIGYDPSKHSAIQSVILTLHIALGVGLLVGSFAHILTSRKSHLLGVRPILGFILIVTAFASGSIAAKNGNNLAVLVMALCFGAAILVYGSSYLKVKVTNS